VSLSLCPCVVSNWECMFTYSHILRCAVDLISPSFAIKMDLLRLGVRLCSITTCRVTDCVAVTMCVSVSLYDGWLTAYPCSPLSICHSHLMISCLRVQRLFSQLHHTLKRKQICTCVCTVASSHRMQHIYARCHTGDSSSSGLYGRGVSVSGLVFNLDVSTITNIPIGACCHSVTHSTHGLSFSHSASHTIIVSHECVRDGLRVVV